MGTKWKNKTMIALLAITLTFGMSGILTFLAHGSSYFERDYFTTSNFHGHLHQFASSLSIHELNETTLEDAKKAITVTNEEIEEHRYRYGDLNEQIHNIENQYASRIDEAKATNNQAAADLYTKERDEKIKDITMNFESDEHVREKIVKEKEQQIEYYFEEREKQRSDFLRYKKAFNYYYKDSVSGKVFTNTSISKNEDVKDYVNPNDTYFVTSYAIPNDLFIYNLPASSEIEDALIPKEGMDLEGQIWVDNSSLASSNFLTQEYEDYQQKHQLFWIYVFSSLASLLLSVIIFKKSKVVENEASVWRPYYNKLPIDSRFVFLGITSIAAFLFMVISMESFVYSIDIPEMVVTLIVSSAFVILSIIQVELVSSELKNWQTVKNEWANGLLVKAWRGLKYLYKQGSEQMKEAFWSQSTGTQLFIITAIVFGLGLSAILIFIHPAFLLIYMILLGVVGVPIVLILIDWLVYFNRIVKKTNELAVGNLGEDLQVSGKSVLATLAKNMNVLKQGVKTSLSEQAKSERMKTELITNVSHDLRTPLTSIITYTELLKGKDITDEDKNEYLEIIDRKSKRLKVLIDDLFEVSKMASGNIQLNKEKVDLVQLLQQALGEYDDAIKESNLQFRVTNSEKPILALVDGQKMWRVFDNLIGNILKYSLENTRVYIAVKKHENKAVITFKNVSKFELGENPDELFERFKRGDESRHTEGSGLGLAIAKSIVDLHEGILDIDSDGDLFKVTISLWLEE